MKGLIYILWHARHELYHVLLGLMWAWFLREVWNEFNLRWIWVSVIGSLLPDADHLLYFITYGRKDIYTQNIKSLFRNHQWRDLTVFMENGHKYQTNLTSHNIYFVCLLIVLSAVSFLVEWEVGFILFVAMVIHYLFDIADDFLVLGTINPNWKRWGRDKRSMKRRRTGKSVITDLS